jgi:hypothetical protein
LGVLERAQRSYIQFGRPAEQRKDPVTLADAQPAEHIGEPIGLIPQVSIGQLGCRAILGQAA